MADAGEGSPALIFGSATPTEVDEVVALVQSAYRGDDSRAGWTTEADLLEGQRVDHDMVLEMIERPDSRVMTVRCGGELVACCELQRKGGTTGHLGMFAVRPAVQNSGLGRRVLEEAERVARAEWGIERMEMTVLDLREELLAWYQRRGYAATGESGDFPYDDERYGRPTRPDLRFSVLAKDLTPPDAS